MVYWSFMVMVKFLMKKHVCNITNHLDVFWWLHCVDQHARKKTNRCAGDSLNLKCEMRFKYVHVYTQNEWSTPSCTWNYLIYKQYSRSCGTVVTTENELWAGKFLAGAWDLSSSKITIPSLFPTKAFSKIYLLFNAW